jgi:hypothetical protein
LVLSGIEEVKAMTKQQVIDILESYKPSGNIYNGYNSIEEKVDEKICSLIDEIIESVKYEPDDWIKCSEKMPENGKSVLVAIKEDGDIDICVGETFGEGNWMISGEFWYEKSDPSITHWMSLPELPKGENDE